MDEKETGRWQLRVVLWDKCVNHLKMGKQPHGQCSQEREFFAFITGKDWTSQSQFSWKWCQPQLASSQFLEHAKHASVLEPCPHSALCLEGSPPYLPSQPELPCTFIFNYKMKTSSNVWKMKCDSLSSVRLFAKP